MSRKLYCVEVCQELITPILVSATSKHEAKELVMDEQGEVGDYYFGGHKIISVRVQNNVDEQSD